MSQNELDWMKMPGVNLKQTGTNPSEVVFPTGQASEVVLPTGQPSEVDINPFIDNPDHTSVANMSDPFQAVVDEVKNDQQQIPKSNSGTKKIMDLFWLLNDKAMLPNSTMGDNEAHFVTISYNITFGNLRIGYHTLENVMQGHVVFADKLRENTMAIGTLYPTNLFKMGIMGAGKFRCIEQLITKTDEPWQQNRPATDIERIIELNENKQIKKDVIIITINNRETGQSPWYEFKGWQKDALIHACRFGVTTGFELMGGNIIKTR